MSASPLDRRDRCDDLLIQSAIYGLDKSQQQEMDQLFREFELSSDDRFDSTIGALDAATDDNRGSSLPADFSAQLRQKILDDAGAHFDGDLKPSVEPRASRQMQPASNSGFTRREAFLGFVTAASLLTAIGSLAGWFKRRDPGSAGKDVSSTTPPTPAEQLAQLVKDAPDDLRDVAWQTTDDPAASNASGRVVWSDNRQEGYMVFDGMEVNDPASNQYQLWIFDSARNDELPVDGGVFDITTAGELVVSIDAKLFVSQAKMFAVTIEQPMGVVQSKRERLPLLATFEL